MDLFQYRIINAFQAAKDLVMKPQIDEELVLNTFGSDGWELISIRGEWNALTGSSPSYVFKRKIISSPPPALLLSLQSKSRHHHYHHAQ